MARQDNPAFAEVMAIRGKGMPPSGEVSIVGAEPMLATEFRIAETTASVLAGVGVAMTDLLEMKTGRRQRVSVSLKAAAAGLKSQVHLQRPDRDGYFQPVVNHEHEEMIRCTQPWPTKDGRWFLPHLGLPNLAERVTKVLECEASPEAVARAVARWNALDLEDAIDKARACGGMVRSNAEWLATPHGKVLAGKPIVEIIKIGDSDPIPLPKGPRLLEGLRVLDLTRILAGPVAARTLAEQGADVLMVTKRGLPQVPEHVIDTSHGKRSAFLDLKTAEDAATLKRLVEGADVFSQGYRPGVMARLGFAPEDLARIKPGLIYNSVSCFGADGPFSHRAGWEQIAQTVTGICHDGRIPARPDGPALLPGAACDYTTGYLAAYGILLALARRAVEGGSYHVRVSLCQSGMFIYRQGKVPFPGFDKGLAFADIDALRRESKPKSGPLRHLGPLMRLSETWPRWERPTPELGGDAPEWPA